MFWGPLKHTHPYWAACNSDNFLLGPLVSKRIARVSRLTPSFGQSRKPKEGFGASPAHRPNLNQTKAIKQTEPTKPAKHTSQTKPNKHNNGNKQNRPTKPPNKATNTQQNKQTSKPSQAKPNQPSQTNQANQSTQPNKPHQQTRIRFPLIGGLAGLPNPQTSNPKHQPRGTLNPSKHFFKTK